MLTLILAQHYNNDNNRLMSNTGVFKETMQLNQEKSRKVIMT